METVSYVGFTFVYVDTGLLVLRKLVACWTRAKMTTDRVGALIRAAAVIFETLVDV